MQKKRGTFVISLDFELYWGMIDKVTLETYGENLRGVRRALPAILSLFEEVGIHASWATLGMLMHETKESLMRALPEKHLRPTYENPALSTYEHIEHFDIGTDESHDPYHFGASLVRKIVETPHQEIASHTFSHYYCIDGSQNSDEIFDADCKAFTRSAAPFGVIPRSIVFPRNQTHESGLRTCKENGIHAYRGTEDHFIYRPRRDDEQSLLIRGLRLLDHYVNITGHHTYSPGSILSESISNIPASRFLRPYNKMLKVLEPLRLRRITKSMTHAAQRGEVFHLWWHPHNFGTNLGENMRNLREIARHFKKLEEQYSMQSLTMSETASLKNN